MGKYIITGPGRSGTTFLIQLLTRLGFDSGFKAYKEPYNPDWRAGCEVQVDVDLAGSPTEARQLIFEAPQVLKAPEWALVLKGYVQAGVIDIDHVFIPVRDLDIAARSRLNAGLDWQVCETDDYDYRVIDQASVHALALGRAVEACVVCALPFTLMAFPRLVEDVRYCYNCLTEGLTIYWSSFEREFKQLARPEQIRWS